MPSPEEASGASICHTSHSERTEFSPDMAHESAFAPLCLNTGQTEKRRAHSYPNANSDSPIQ